MVRIKGCLQQFARFLWRFIVILCEVKFILYFISQYFLLFDNPDDFYGFELDSRSENLFFIVGSRNNRYICQYSFENDSVSVLAVCPRGKYWYFPALSPFDDEIAFAEQDIVDNTKSNLKVFNINLKYITDSLYKFNATPMCIRFNGSRNNIVFTAFGTEEFGSPVANHSPRGFDIFNYNRITKIVNRITNTNTKAFHTLSNFRNDSLMVIEQYMGTQLYKFSPENPDSFKYVLGEEFAKYGYQVGNSKYCAKRNKIFLEWKWHLFEIDPDNLKWTHLFELEIIPNILGELELSTNCDVLFYTKSKDIDYIYRYNIQTREMMPPIVLKYPKSMLN
jgi:hypothetical protein